LRVLHVFKTYYPNSFGGIERVIWEIAEGTVSRGVTTEVFSLGPKAGRGEVANHAAIYARRDVQIASSGFSLSSFGSFAEAARSADVVHYHFPWPGGDLLHLLARPNKPSVVTYHSDIVRQVTLGRLYAPVRRMFLGAVDRIVATSSQYVASSPVLGRYAQKLSVVPIGISERAQPAAQLVEGWRGRVGSGFFLFVGQLRYYKGLQYLLEAAKQTGLPVVVAGEGELSQAIADAALPNVTVVGGVSDEAKEALLELCGVFVFPSHLRSEAFGVSLLEAARAGRAMICCEIGTGTTLVNEDQETGLVIGPADSADLAKAMVRLANDPAGRDRMGANARLRYERIFTGRQMAAAYHEIYAELVACR
jgi:glycosyltransferase involved in cell wall biosynthesis